MNRRDYSLTLSLCGSLAIHALVGLVACEAYARGGGQTILPSLIDPVRGGEEWIVLRGNRWGELDGSGTSPHASPGDEVLLASQAAQDQPFLSRDPVGPGHPLNLPSQSTLPLGTAGGGGPETASALASGGAPTGAGASDVAEQSAEHAPRVAVLPQRQDMLIGAAPAASDMPTPIAPPPEPVETQPADPVEPPAAAEAPVEAETVDAAASPPLVAMAAPSSGTPAAGPPGSPVPPADPAPASDSESDPFSLIGSATWRDGRLDVRSGRRVTSVRPRLSLAQQIELASIQAPRIVLQVQTDNAGIVRDVQVHGSCGSDSIDQTVKVAMYEWWFEPARDSAGQPRPDTFLFAISFR